MVPALKERKETPIMAQYQSIKIQHPGCLLFFRLGEFYELFFEDAKIASAALDIVLTARDKTEEDPVPMCGVPVHASENYIARLIKKGFHVALCEQVERVQDKVGKGPIKREVVRIITPGTLVEDTLLESGRNNFLMAIGEDPTTQTLSMASVDISTGDFFIETHAKTELTSVLARLNPQEILLPEPLLDTPQWKALWSEWKTKITTIPSSRLDPRNGEERLMSFFKVQTLRGFGTFSSQEIAVAGALLDYVLLSQKRHVLCIARPQRLEEAQFLNMDAFTRRSLEIVQTFAGEKNGSLVEVLDHTLTPMGARLFFLRLTHPIKDREALQSRLDSVEFFVNHPELRGVLRTLLRGVLDIERALSRLLLGKGSPKDMGAIRTTLLVLPTLTVLLKEAPLSEELAALLTHLTAPQEIANLLNRALQTELPLFLRDGGVIAPGYNKTLDEYRTLKLQEETIVQQLQKKYADETGLSTLKIRYNQIIGYYIEVSLQAASKVPFHFIVRQSLVSSMRYVTAELTDLEQRLRHASERTLTLEMDLFESLVKQLEESRNLLRSVVQALAILDVSSALGELAATHQYVRPTLETSLAFSIQGGRHPVVERAFQSPFKKPFVKNDCHLNPHRLWLLTGPNMAGKSTFLRQNALIILMAHVGSFVPADSACIGLVDRLFSRVGAADDLARGYSTFMVEMVETAAILNQATEKSFVIFDEVGRGTATYDGLSLAWSCVEHLSQMLRCRTLFATHYHELTALSTLPEVGLYTLRIREWEKNIVFLHEVIPGSADRSYGLHVARLAGMPESVIQRAETLLKNFESPPHAHGFKEFKEGSIDP